MNSTKIAPPSKDAPPILDSNGTTIEADAIAVAIALAESRPNGATKQRAFIPKPGQASLKTGHRLVDAIGSIQLQGIQLDANWLKHPAFQNENGKPNLTAILIYADLVDWYRPYKKRDVFNPDHVMAVKKFEGEYLVKIYAKWARDLGVGTDTIKKCVAMLCERGLVAKRTPSERVRRQWSDPEHGNEKPMEFWPLASMLREVSGASDGIFYAPAPHLLTGNPICDELLQIRLRGNVIDFNWLVHPALRTGVNNKLNVTALFAFADLFFLHTPTPQQHPTTHAPEPAKKKFRGDVLTKNYEPWATYTGLTEKQLTTAVTFLADARLLERWVDKVKLPDGEFTNQKAFIRLRFEPVLDLTFGPRAANDSAKKVGGKNVVAPIQESLFDSESGRKKENGNHPIPHFPKSEGKNCRDFDGKIVGTSTEKLSAYIEPFVEAQLKNQQQQEPQLKDFGDDGFDSKESGANETQTPQAKPSEIETEIARRTREVVEKLHAFGTGCALKTIRAAALDALEHAELWAQHWPSIEESSPAFWVGHPSGSNCGAALAKRLRDVGQIPPVVVAQRAAEEQRAEATRKRDERAAAQTLAQRREAEDRRAQRQFALTTFERFLALSDELQVVATSRVEVGGLEFFIARSPGKTLDRLIAAGIAGAISDQPTEFNLAQRLNVAIDLAESAATAPAIVETIADVDDEKEVMPSLLEHLQNGGRSPLVDELVRDLRDGMLDLAALDGQKPHDYTIPEWEVVKARVEREIGDVATPSTRAAQDAAPPAIDLNEIARAEADRADGLWGKISDASRYSLSQNVDSKLLELSPEGRTEDARIEIRRALVCDWFEAPYNPPRRALPGERNENEEEQADAQSA